MKGPLMQGPFRFVALAVALSAFLVGVPGARAARAQTAADVAAAVGNMCAVMAGERKADSRTLQYLLLLDSDYGDGNPVEYALSRGVLHQCPKAYLAFEQRKRANNPFAHAGLTKDTPTLLNGGSAALVAPKVFGLRCRGGHGIASAQGATLILQFTKSPHAAGAGLGAGQCSWDDRPLGAAEPARIVVPLASAAIAHNGVAQVNAGGTWTFWVYDAKTSLHATKVAKGTPAKP